MKRILFFGLIMLSGPVHTAFGGLFSNKEWADLDKGVKGDSSSLMDKLRKVGASMKPVITSAFGYGLSGAKYVGTSIKSSTASSLGEGSYVRKGLGFGVAATAAAAVSFTGAYGCYKLVGYGIESAPAAGDALISGIYTGMHKIGACAIESAPKIKDAAIGSMYEYGIPVAQKAYAGGIASAYAARDYMRSYLLFQVLQSPEGMKRAAAQAAGSAVALRMLRNLGMPLAQLSYSVVSGESIGERLNPRLKNLVTSSQGMVNLLRHQLRQFSSSNQNKTIHDILLQLKQQNSSQEGLNAAKKLEDEQVKKQLDSLINHYDDVCKRIGVNVVDKQDTTLHAAGWLSCLRRPLWRYEIGDLCTHKGAIDRCNRQLNEKLEETATCMESPKVFVKEYIDLVVQLYNLCEPVIKRHIEAMEKLSWTIGSQ